MPGTAPQPNSPEAALTAAASRGIKATVWGIVASTILALTKITAGVAGNSYALIADGVESILDIVSSLVVWGSLRIASQPATDRFPYGYGKVEPLAALAVATILLGAAIAIAIESVRAIQMPHHLPAAFTLWVLVGVVVVKEVMFRVLFRTGESIRSKAMQTDAWHHRSDSLTSIAAFVGISIALYAGEGYESADDWAALFAAAVIAFNGVRLFRSALTEVLDVAPPPDLVERIRKIAGAVPGVVALDKCRARSSGLIKFIDLHVIVDGDISVRRGHAISHEVKDALLASNLGIRDVTVHVEPDNATRTDGE